MQQIMSNISSSLIMVSSLSVTQLIVYAGQLTLCIYLIWTLTISLIGQRLRTKREKLTLPCGALALLLGIIAFLSELIFQIRPAMNLRVSQQIGITGAAIIGALLPVYSGMIVFALSAIIKIVHLQIMANIEEYTDNGRPRAGPP